MSDNSIRLSIWLPVWLLDQLSIEAHAKDLSTSEHIRAELEQGRSKDSPQTPLTNNQQRVIMPLHHER